MSVRWRSCTAILDGFGQYIDLFLIDAVEGRTRVLAHQGVHLLEVALVNTATLHQLRPSAQQSLHLAQLQSVKADQPGLVLIQSPDCLGAQCAIATEAIQCPSPCINIPAPVKRYHDEALSGQAIIGSSRIITLGVQPNPMLDRIRLIRLPATAPAIVLCDAMGRVALAGALVQNTIDLSALAGGSYLAEVLDTRGALRVLRE